MRFYTKEGAMLGCRIGYFFITRDFIISCVLYLGYSRYGRYGYNLIGNDSNLSSHPWAVNARLSPQSRMMDDYYFASRSYVFAG